MSEDLNRESRGRAGVILAVFLGLAVLVVAIGAVAYFLTVRPAESLIDRVADAVRTITGADTTVESEVVTLETGDVTELAVVSRKTQAVVKTKSAVLGSESVLILKGTFVVKAGYDLAKNFRFEIGADGEVRAELPPPEILSVEMTDYEVFHAKEGLWNRLTPDDQAIATKEMLIQARQDAEESDILEEAEAKILTRLEDLISTGGERQSLDVF